MLGRMAQKPVGQLIGEIHNPEVGVYMATEWREKPVEESIKLIQEAVADYDVHALKIKVGGLMFMTTDMYAVGPPGRTEKMIPLVRKTFGDKMALYADSNSFYSVPEAIRVGKLLEEYKFVVLRRARDVRPHRGDQTGRRRADDPDRQRRAG